VVSVKAAKVEAPLLLEEPNAKISNTFSSNVSSCRDTNAYTTSFNIGNTLALVTFTPA